ncbi:MAG: hypothetical protein WCJ03_04400, partial [Bacteroidales bacterium]
KKYPSEGILYEQFSDYYSKGVLKDAVAEKQHSAQLWDSIVALSRLVKSKQPKDDAYIRVSSLYGLYLHRIIAAGWEVMALGFEGDKTGKYNRIAIQKAIKTYDAAWSDFQNLKKQESTCATLYKPNAFIFVGPNYFYKKGIGYSVDKYRKL